MSNSDYWIPHDDRMEWKDYKKTFDYKRIMLMSLYYDPISFIRNLNTSQKIKTYLSNKYQYLCNKYSYTYEKKICIYVG